MAQKVRRRKRREAAQRNEMARQAAIFRNEVTEFKLLRFVPQVPKITTRRILSDRRLETLYKQLVPQPKAKPQYRSAKKPKGRQERAERNRLTGRRNGSLVANPSVILDESRENAGVWGLGVRGEHPPSPPSSRARTIRIDRLSLGGPKSPTERKCKERPDGVRNKRGGTGGRKSKDFVPWC